MTPFHGTPAPGRVYLNTLAPGTRFHVGATTLTGTLHRIGSSSCTVHYDGLVTVEVAGKHFSRPLAPVEIAPQTEVTLLRNA